jgi:hypothetical protein
MPWMVISEQVFQSALSTLVGSAINHLGGNLSFRVSSLEYAHCHILAVNLGFV